MVPQGISAEPVPPLKQEAAGSEEGRGQLCLGRLVAGRAGWPAIAGAMDGPRPHRPPFLGTAHRKIFSARTESLFSVASWSPWQSRTIAPRRPVWENSCFALRNVRSLEDGRDIAPANHVTCLSWRVVNPWVYTLVHLEGGVDRSKHALMRDLAMIGRSRWVVREGENNPLAVTPGRLAQVQPLESAKA